MQQPNTTLTDVYALVTNQVIELLEHDTIPWRNPWAAAGQPYNLLTGRPYQGINALLLSSMNFSQNAFLTWKQLKSIEGSVVKGEKSSLVVFSKETEVERRKEGKTTIEKKWVLRFYKVFNIEQCTDIPTAFLPKDQGAANVPILECASVIDNMPNPPTIVHKGMIAYYDVEKDKIGMPKPAVFESSDFYYATLYHELVHSTGYKLRLNRKEVMEKPKFGSPAYALEELTGEIGSCFLYSYTGIAPKLIPNTAAYIASWLKALRDDKSLILKAASRAQKAVDYILNKTQPADVKDEELELNMEG